MPVAAGKGDFGRGMDDAVHAFHSLFQSHDIEDITRHPLDLPYAICRDKCRYSIAAPKSTDSISFFDQLPDDIRPEKPRTPGDQDHSFL
jgi:hypothetical protein